MDTDKLGQVIYDKALACGFDDCGIIPIDDMDGFQQRLQERKRKFRPAPLPENGRFCEY